MNTKIIIAAIFVFAVFSTKAGIDPEKLERFKERVTLNSSMMDCQPAQAQYDLEINNVRARLLTGGDMWWNLEDGRYIVPKPAPGYPEVSAIFASGLWIGGIDPNGALKLAGVTYRNGNATDYYSGPLDENGQTNYETCNDWDRHFVVKGENIRLHIANYKESVANNMDYPCVSIPDDVKYWPARGNPFFGEKYDFSLPDQSLANFWDEDGDNLYNPCKGDYPIIHIRGCDNRDGADEIVFWIFNDNGGPHMLSQATAIQMEVQAHAYAYATQNELNDMTFYKFKLVNKASDDIRDCYFGLWVDPDLGCPEDDYIGCDVNRSMAYIYNKDAVDGNPGASCPSGIATYGDKIPMIGIDLFSGPRGPKVFKRDSNGNPVYDQEGNVILEDPMPGTGAQDTLVELGMTSFVYQNHGTNVPEPTTDPQTGYEFYNILKGRWKDGTAVTFGNSGFDPGSTDTIRYVFPDEPNDGTGWSMCTADLPFSDRRTVQGTGPFLMQPGAKNEMIFGVVFVPNVVHPCPDISKLQFADDLAQALFDNCFDIVEGPDAPDLEAVRLDQQLIFILSNNKPLSNNKQEQFMTKDLMAPPGVGDSLYKFEGYKIYQVSDPTVTGYELDNINKARLIRQVDIKNGIDEIYNWFPLPNPDPASSDIIWVPERQVDGEDKGIKHSFNILYDKFSNSAQERLKNGQEYYFTVIAYAHNNYQQYIPSEGIGQRKSYLEGRRNVRTYTFVPRALEDVDIPTTYGQEAAVTRIDGKGTSFNALDLEDGEIKSILDGTFDGSITYKAGNGPINPKIVNPLIIQDGQYRLEIIGEYDDSPSHLKFEEGATWQLTDMLTNEIIASDHTIEQINEQIIHDKGFSIQVNQSGEPGELFDENNGAISQTFEYKDEDEPNWWNAIPGYTGIEVSLGGGVSEYFFPFVELDQNDDDPNNVLSKMGPGHFIPFKSAKWIGSDIPYITPGWKESQGFAIAQDKLILQHLNNVDIVFTSDKTKWSKCIIVESTVKDYKESGLLSRDERTQFDLRSDASVDKNGNTIEGEGMGYFPGYAIDVETGERLNIFFGENSAFSPENDALVNQTTGLTVNSGGIGSDMIWNPSTELFLDGAPLQSLGPYSNLAGGQHYVYVTRQEYDGCEALSELLGSGGILNKVNAVSFITWTGIPIPQESLLTLGEGLIPNDLTVKLRVTSPFNKEIDISDNKNPIKFEAIGGLPVYNFGFENVEITGTVSITEPKILDKIIISPNPLYENSQAGQGSSDNVVKITNLPHGSVVTVYTLEGKFIKRLSEDMGVLFSDTGTGKELKWNLNDSDGIHLSSGIYIFHIAVPHLGIQKAVKWIKG